MYYDGFSNDLKLRLEQELPGEKAHAHMAPVNRPLETDLLGELSGYRASAVAVFLFRHNSSIQSVLIQRPDYDGAHSGQIAFPGGKQEPEDPDLIHTARRESFEEISMPIDYGEFIGALSDVYIPVSKFIVKPYIFYHESIPSLIPDSREVQKIIPFDVQELLNENNRRATDIRLGNGLIRKDVPYYDIYGHKVWGATAMMLSELKSVLKDL